MARNRWEFLEEIFQAAISRPTDQRASFIDQACAGDEPLRREVERLAASFEEASDFIETPAYLNRIQSSELADRITDFHSRSTGGLPCELEAGLAVGRKIHQYELLSLLGAGGMGEVYLARDERLDRQVALKLLPPHFTPEAAHVRRFEREARAASSLNHPNIITIHEIGEVDDRWNDIEFLFGRRKDCLTTRDNIQRPFCDDFLDPQIDRVPGWAGSQRGIGRVVHHRRPDDPSQFQSRGG